ncbi:hypothetical protein [Vagococcus fluvialis]|uniref:hypothetical protein n=1 Tax=Vagococcus fluvialis TaxID=2738 RepID=UPI003B2239C3
MKIVEYVAVFKELNGQFYVFFPDLPKIEVYGKTLIISKERAFSCLKEFVLNSGILPMTTSINELEELYPNDVVSLIQVRV